MCSYLEWQLNVDPSVLVDYYVVIEELLRLDPTYTHPAIPPIWDSDRTHYSCRDMIVDVCHKMEPTSLIVPRFPLCLSPTLEATKNMTLTTTTSLASSARASHGSSPQRGKGVQSLTQQLERSNSACFFRRPTSSATSATALTGAASSGRTTRRSGAPPSTPQRSHHIRRHPRAAP